MLLAPNQSAPTACEELLAKLTQIGCARCPKGPAGQPNGRHLCRVASPSGHLKIDGHANGKYPKAHMSANTSATALCRISRQKAIKLIIVRVL